jgi:hypothetical protein
MAKKGFLDNSDPTKAPGEYDAAPAGDYAVNKIEFFVGESKFPEYVDDEFRGRVARLRLTTTDGAYELPMSATPVDLVLMAKAYGVSIKELPSPRDTTEFLVKVEEAINKTGKAVKVHVNDGGWVSYVHDAAPPEGYYRFKVVKAMSNDRTEPVRFLKIPNAKFNPDSESVMIWFELSSDMMGRPTPFDGYQFMVRMYQPFDGAEDGQPKTRVNPNGGTPMDVQRLYRLITCYCPEMFEYEWVCDMGYSEYGIDESENPIVVILDHAIKGGREAVGHFAPNRRGRLTLDLLSLQALDEGPVEEKPSAEEKPSEDSEIEFFALHEYLVTLCSWIDSQVPGGAFAKMPPTKLEDLVFNDAGKKWANENLPEIMVKARIELKKRPINSLTEEEAEKICRTAGLLGHAQPEDEGLPSEETEMIFE